ncbi:MAG: ATP-binding protein [Anaerolineae bacterium]|nr:ATP-binding protein [Anaerolineae bacterium]
MSVPLDATNEERRRKLLHVLLGIVVLMSFVGVVFTACADVFNWDVTSEELLMLYLSTGGGIATSVVVFFVSKRSLRVASWAFVFLLLLASALCDVPQYIVDGRSLIAFTVPIIVAGALLPAYAPLLVAGLGVLSIVGMGVYLGEVPTPSAILLFFLAAPLVLLTNTLERAIGYWRAIEAALRESEARERARAAELEAIMDAVPAAIWISRDPKCHFITGNRTSYDWLRMPGGINSSLTPAEGSPPGHFKFCRNGVEIPPEKLSMQRAATYGMPVKNFEEEIVYDDGGVRYLFGNAAPFLSDDGAVRGTVSAFVDITDRKRVEVALRESEARFRELAWENAVLLEQARKDAQMQETLLQEVNHRVKNNLAAIIGLIQAEKRRARLGAEPSCLSAMDGLAQRIRGLALVHDMLSAVDWSPLRLDRLIYEVASSVFQMATCDCPVSLDVAESPVRVTDKQASSLALVLNELAMNVNKYVVSAGVAARVSVCVDVVEGAVSVEWRDDGPGFPAQVLNGEAQGVGLYLVNALMRHDLYGDVMLCNDHGAVVRLTFPQAQTIE